MESLKQYLKQKSLIKFAAGFAAIVIVVWGGYLLWTNLRYDPIKAYEKAEKAYIEAMTADTYGGKTPQETLDLFVAALRAGDVELASKYFLLNTDSGDKNYLTRKKDEELFKKAQSENRLEEITNLTSRAILQSNQPTWDKNQVWYGVYDQGKLIADITLRFNEFSKIWKIESL